MKPNWLAAKIVGVYTTKQSRDLSERGGFSLAFEALLGAAADAGVDISEIDGISSTVTGWPVAGVSPAMQATFWATQLGRPMRWTAAGSGLLAIADAVMAIEYGLASTVAIVVGMTRPPASGATAPWTRPNEEFTAWTGSYTAVQYALVARRYMHEFGDSASRPWPRPRQRSEITDMSIRMPSTMAGARSRRRTCSRPVLSPPR